MDTALIIDGKKYVPAREAAELIGYEPDYIGQLVRGGKVSGKLVGRAWYIDLDEIRLYAQNRTREKRGRKKTGVLGIQLKKRAARKSGKSEKGHEKESVLLPGAEEDPLVRTFWPSFSAPLVASVAPKLQSVVVQKSELATPLISNEEPKVVPVLPKIKDEQFKAEIAEETREIISPEQSKAVRAEPPTPPKESQGTSVPITYHPDSSALMPLLVRKPTVTRVVRRETITPQNVAPKMAPVVTTARAQEILQPRNIGMFGAIGKLIGAGFAISAIVFGLISVSVVSNYEIQSAGEGVFSAASNLSLQPVAQYIEGLQHLALNTAYFIDTLAYGFLRISGL